MKNRAKRNRLAKLQHAAERMRGRRTAGVSPASPSIRQHLADTNKREVIRG